ncbi:polyketide synthase [Xylaria telfairii]|nr:polyketide synthase [Xylaria telfairii]
MALGREVPRSSIAVVGVSCRLPGGANDLDRLWELLECGVETWSPVPAERFNESAFYHPSPDNPNGTTNHQGGHFIDGDLRDFDHTFFRLSSQQASCMDPQQRMLLEMSYEAFENAGWPRESYQGSNTAVYVAMFTTDFDRNVYKDPLDLPTHYLLGTEEAVLANRISYVFDLHGPSMTLDTGCSGGLVALHQAVQSLRDGESNAALVAATNLTISPEHHIGMSNLHLLSANGHCYPFDICGEGYGRGEGLVVLLLKRLDDAIRDRDPVHAIIRSTAVNQDGYTPAGITYPNGSAQASLIRTAYSRAGLLPQEVLYVEAHGTGTVAGDHEELSAISEVFKGVEREERALPLYVGSMKGAIGHTESTSGLASLLKSILILKKGKIPPVAGFSKPKLNLPLDQIRIPTETISWPAIEGIIPRISINSFGFGGANAHAILEETPRYLNGARTSDFGSPLLFLLSANSKVSLLSVIESLLGWLENRPETSLVDLSYTLCQRRTALPFRFSCISNDHDSLMQTLRKSLDGLKTRRVLSKKTVNFVFTGQGAQWLGMGRELLSETCSSFAFRASIRSSGDFLRELGATWDLETELLRDVSEPTLLNTAEVAQPATTAIQSMRLLLRITSPIFSLLSFLILGCQFALVALLDTWGIWPHVVVGHSSGEIAAAYTAGYLSHRAAIAIAFHRGFMAVASKTRGLPEGAMMSVGLGEEETALYLQNLEQGAACIACINSPQSVTISGDAGAIDEVAARLANSGSNIFHRRLLVDTAYHSHHMQAVARDYRARLEHLDIGEFVPSERGITFISSVSGSLKSSEFGHDYWVENLVSPVRFCDAIQTLTKYHGVNDRERHIDFVEIGPHHALAGPVRQSLMDLKLKDIELDYDSVLRRGVDAVSSALALAGRLFEQGINPDITAVSALIPGYSIAAVCTSLPTYRWDHSVKHWHESRLSREYRFRRDPYNDLLGIWAVDSTTIEPRWRHMVGLTTLPWLADHIIDGRMIFPGSGYICMAVEGIMQLRRDRYPTRALEDIVLRNVSFLRALVIPDSPRRLEMQLSFSEVNRSEFGFDFRIASFVDSEWVENCKGAIEGLLIDDDENPIPTLESLTNEVPQGIFISVDEVYEQLAAAGNVYGPIFAAIRSFAIAEDEKQATAVIEVPDIASKMPAQHHTPYLIHPTTLDAILHTSLPLVARSLGSGSVMPVHIAELVITAGQNMPQAPGSRIDVSTTLQSSHFRTAYAELSVIANSLPVLSISGVELRSLGERESQVKDLTKLSGICYEMEWKGDIEHLRVEDLGPDPSFADLIGHLCFKHANISVAEFVGKESVEESFLRAVDFHTGSLAVYDFFDTNHELNDHVGRQGQPQFIDPNETAVNTDSKTYDVVLSSTTEALKRALSVVKPTGILIMVLKQEILVPDQVRHAVLQDLEIPFELQLSFYDATLSRSIIMAKPALKIAQQPSLEIQVISHSGLDSPPSWAATLITGLQTSGNRLSLERLRTRAIEANLRDDLCAIVIDDKPQPILSDPGCFDAATKLLRAHARVIWLSPDDDPAMHQITGVARSAHAENDHLQLTTIHVSPAMREHPRLHELVNLCLDSRSITNREREYRVSEYGTILIPRLRPSKEINRAISSDQSSSLEVETWLFGDSLRSSSISIKRSKSPEHPLFVEDNDNSLVKPLGPEEIQIRAESIALSKAYSTLPFGVYAGTVTRIGPSVNSFAVGDPVVALGTTAGSSHPCLPQPLAASLPINVSPTVAAALLLSALAAYHSLHNLARLKPKDAVLIHGALSPHGRAVAACAQAIGANVTVTAVKSSEKVQVAEQLGICESDVLVLRPSFQHQSSRGVLALALDVIIQATDEPLPSDVLGCLKASGCVIAMSGDFKSTIPINLPLNATLHRCDIEDLIASHPCIGADLLGQASQILGSISTRGMPLFSLNVEQVSEALHLIDNKARTQVVLEVNSNSHVSVMRTKTLPDCWRTVDSSYVVSGGLGDLGRRILILMAHRGAKSLITLSRRAVDSETHDFLQSQLQAIEPGCRLSCVQCDITAENSLMEAAQSIVRMGLPPVRGVIQSAVILQDRTLERMTYDEFSLVTEIKVAGTLALHRAFASPHLEFFIMLSSTANIIGTSGQANYNAGNATQDSISQANDDNASCHFLSLDIGWIEDAVATANETRENAVRRAGLKPISHDQLSRFLNYALGAAASKRQLRQMVIGFDTISVSQSISQNGNVRSPMFCHVRGAPMLSEDMSSLKSSTPLSFANVVSNGDHELIVEFIANAVVDKLTRLMFLDANQINPAHGSILALGVDSLVAIELRNWVAREFDAHMQSSELISDQTIRALAEKITRRSRTVLESSTASQDGQTEDSHILDDQTQVSSVSSLDKQEIHVGLPSVPIPSLETTLQGFVDSRRAIDSEDDQQTTSKAVQEFLEGPGRELQQRLKNSTPADIADSYERQIYLNRRDPLQDYNEFSLVHPLNAPSTSQALRAAILCTATIEFARRLAAGEVAPDTMHGAIIDNEAHGWIFYCTRQPRADSDQMERYAISETFAVLRRGHIFQVQLPGLEETVNIETMHAAFHDILQLSEDPKTPICILTSDERDSWASLHRQLETDAESAATLRMIDAAAFVVCLDDESPTSAGERHIQFLLNGRANPFANRWLDKPLQLAVAANGVSAGVFGHTKIDGLDARALHVHISEALQAHTGLQMNGSTASPKVYQVHEHFIKPNEEVIARIEHLRSRSSTYEPIDQIHVDIDNLGVAFLHNQGSQPNATAHLIVLLALYLVDGFIRQAWEIASLAQFHRGRIDWVQTVSPAMRTFLEAAGTLASSGNEGNSHANGSLRLLLTEAISTHAKAVLVAAHGAGFVRHLYALRGIATEDNLANDERGLAFFKTRAWDYTRRDGLGQDLKIGFMPSDDGELSGGKMRWEEGGFLMQGERGIYVQCGVHEDQMNFVVSARSAYAAEVCASLPRAAGIVRALLEEV